jgi:hypothetical protein
MDLSDNRKCGQEKTLYHILCQCPVLAGHSMKIFGPAWLELTYKVLSESSWIFVVVVVVTASVKEDKKGGQGQTFASLLLQSDETSCYLWL